MAIKLRIISEHYRDLGEHRSRVFGVNGGTIGRAPDNDWILPDSKRVLSGHHCEIEYRSGTFWLKDTSTNGVYVNEADDPAFAVGPVELRDGDRLRMADYEVLVSLDSRIDFLPTAAERQSAANHIDTNLEAQLDLPSLLRPRDTADSGSLRMRNAFGMKVPRETPKAAPPVVKADEPPPPPRGNEKPFTPVELPESLRNLSATPAPVPVPRAEATPIRTPESPPDAPGARSTPVDDTGEAAPSADWALATRAITRQEIPEIAARRRERLEQRERSAPFHQQANTWSDLRSATQAFCRGAGIDVTSLSSEAQAVLPLLAGQLLREAVVGLTDILRARPETPGAPPGASGNGTPPGQGSNPLRTSTSIEQALQRLLESHNRLHGGPVDALRDVMQDLRDHESAVQDAYRAALATMLEQLAPANIADQFENGRARTLAPGQDPRPKYWEHYGDFYRVLTQNSQEGLPHSFVEAFGRAYAQSRAELRNRRRGRD